MATKCVQETHKVEIIASQSEERKTQKKFLNVRA